MTSNPARAILAGLLAVVMSLSLILPAAAAPASLSDVTYQAGGQAQQPAAVRIQEVQDQAYLFLPASADLTALALTFSGGEITLAGDAQTAVASGVPFDLTGLFDQAPADGVYPVTLSRGSQRLHLNIAASAAVASVYLTSADPDKDRDWVEQDKDNKAKGQAVVLGPDGRVIYDGGLSQIKGRGNSTWNYPKKPYQIKLDTKCDLMETGDPNEAEKTWVLLANYIDESMVHNSLSYDLAAQMGLAYSPNSRPVDLYYDGEYRGSYLLCEKTEVGEGRVNVHDLEADFEEANPDVDFDDLATRTATNAQGNEYQYVSDLITPADYTGGYLLELDYETRAKEEKSWFATTGGSHVVSKSPEYLSATAMEYISGLYQAFEDAVWNGGVNPDTGKSYTEYVDLTSLAKCYLILELSQDGDAFWSSTYFYKPAGEEKLYAGPVWDFDSAYGTYHLDFPTDILVAGQTPLGKHLLEIPSFRQAVKEAWLEMEPLLSGTVLSGGAYDPAAGLQALTGYGQELAASQRLDHLLWPETTPGSYPQAIADLGTYLVQRVGWLGEEILSWTGGPVYEHTFGDVKESDWFAAAVDYVAGAGFFGGTSSAAFSPNAAMTRAMAATVLYRLAGEPEGRGENPFSDVADGQWYTQAVLWGAETGVLGGYPDGSFRPDGQITRGEFAAVLYRYAQSTGADVTAPALPDTFQDLDQVPDWARAPLAWAVHQKIVGGMGSEDGGLTLDPQGKALRCQAAAMFMRYDQTLEQGDQP